MNSAKGPKKGLTSRGVSVTEIFFTLIACKILQYFPLGIATENTQKRSYFQRKWQKKAFIGGVILVSFMTL